MKKLLLIGFAFASFNLLTACASFSGHSSGAIYPDSELTNANPAPAKLNPPDYGSQNSPVLDSTYLRSQADYHFTLGETLSYEGQSAKAVEEYKLTLIYDPKSVHVRLRMAAEYVRMGMITEAVEQGEIAVEMDPQNVEGRMLLGGLYAGLKMFGPAKKQFQAVIDAHPGHPEASVYLGALMAEQQHYEQAVAYFEALAKNPKFEEPEKAYYYIGRVKSQQGSSEYATAEKAFQKALKPEYPEAAMALGSLYHSEKEDAKMAKLLSSYQDKFGPNLEMAKNLSSYYLRKESFDAALAQLETVDGFEKDNLNIKIQIALILIEQKKYPAAAVRLEDVLIQAPDSDKVRYYLGAVYEEIQRPDLAIGHYSKIQPDSPYYAESVVHEANLLKGQKRLGDAVAVMDKAVQAQKDVPQLYAFYATLLDETKDYAKAKSMLSDAVKRFPDNTQLHFFLGTMDDRLGDTGSTIAEMNSVLKLDKDHVQALNYLAYTLAETGKNLDQAHELAEHALELQPNDGYIMDTLGWIYFKKGDTNTAIKYLEAAQKVKPDEAIIAEHLGDAYLRHQLWGKAQRMYQKAAALEPDQMRNKAIMQKIANLQHQDQTVRSPASVGPEAQ